MGLVLWIVAVILVIWGIVTLVNGSVLLGLLLIIIGFGVGPGGWTFFKSRR